MAKQAWEIGSGPGLGLQITGDLPQESTFANHNYTLSPRNSLIVASGWGQVNQTTLPTYVVDTFDLPFPFHEKTWYRVRTTVENGYLSVAIEDKQVFNISTEPILVNVRGALAPLDFNRRFGLGAYQDQKAYYRNLVVHNQLGEVVYQNNLTTEDVLAEYGVQGNIFPACLDGLKRDRLIWLGDYYHTARIIGASTARYDLERGAFESLLPTQLNNGEFSICAPLGYEANTTVLDDVYGLDDYQLLGMLSLYFYVQSSNDVDFGREHWDQFRLAADWAVGNISTDDGLVYLETAFTGPAEAGSSVSCLTVQALRSMAEVATAVDDFKSSKRWLTAASSLANVTSEKLWNQETGAWKLSTSSPGNFSVTAIAFCIEARVAAPEQATRTVKALDRLALGPGYLDNTIVDPASPTASISPNINGFLLSALFQAGEVERGAKLIDTLWGPMVDNDLTSSGASWEYVLHDGTPGLRLFTSLGHPWDGAATHVLTEWASGLRAAEGVQGWGYRNWLVDPTAGIAMGHKHATARVQTAFDGPIQVT